MLGIMCRKSLEYYLVLFSFVSVFATDDLRHRIDFPHYNISIAQVEPYIMKDGTSYNGYLVDLINLLANQANFTYTLLDTFEDADHQHAGYSERFGKVIGDVVSQTADIGMTDLMVTEEASNAVYFTRPFSISGARILMLKPRAWDNNPMMLLVPLAPELWGLVGCLVILTGSLIYTFNRFSHAPLKNGIFKDLTIPVTCFTVWTKGHPSMTTPSRILLAFWRAFVFITVVSYAANLTRYIFSEQSQRQLEVPFKTFSDMAMQSHVSYGGWLWMPLNTHDALQRKMLKHMNSQYSFYTDLSMAVEEIVSKNGRYVAVVDGQAGEYVVNRDCRFLLLKDELYTIEYSIACSKTQRGREICEAMSDAMVQLQEEGILIELKRKWWSQVTACDHVSEDDFETSHGAQLMKFRPLHIADVTVGCIILGAGVCIAACTWLTQTLRHKRQKKNTDHSRELDKV